MVCSGPSGRLSSRTCRSRDWSSVKSSTVRNASWLPLRASVISTFPPADASWCQAASRLRTSTFFFGSRPSSMIELISSSLVRAMSRWILAFSTGLLVRSSWMCSTRSLSPYKGSPGTARWVPTAIPATTTDVARAPSRPGCEPTMCREAAVRYAAARERTPRGLGARRTDAGSFAGGASASEVPAPGVSAAEIPSADTPAVEASAAETSAFGG